MDSLLEPIAAWPVWVWVLPAIILWWFGAATCSWLLGDPRGWRHIAIGFWPIVTPLWLITWPIRRLMRWRRERRAARAVPQPGYTWAHFNERDYWNDVHPLIVLESTINPPAPKPVPYGSKPDDSAQPVRLDAHRELEARVARLEGAHFPQPLSWARCTLRCRYCGGGIGTTEYERGCHEYCESLDAERRKAQES